MGEPIGINGCGIREANLCSGKYQFLTGQAIRAAKDFVAQYKRNPKAAEETHKGFVQLWESYYQNASPNEKVILIGVLAQYYRELASGLYRSGKVEEAQKIVTQFVSFLKNTYNTSSSLVLKNGLLKIVKSFLGSPNYDPLIPSLAGVNIVPREEKIEIFISWKQPQAPNNFPENDGNRIEEEPNLLDDLIKSIGMGKNSGKAENGNLE